MRAAARLGFFAILGVLAGCGGGPHAPAAPATTAAATSAPGGTPDRVGRPTTAGASASESAIAIVSAPDRPDADKELDAGRHPAEVLTFFGIAPGQRVADIAAAGGYTTELLARAVDPNGTVYGQNSKWILERFAEKPWSRRLARPAMKNVVRVDREFEDPLPPEAQNLDAVVCVMFYHDFVWLDVDRDKMNRAIFKALKPGGAYHIIDHSARAGTGTTETKTLHRIEEKAVRAEIEKAGFRLRREGSFLRNPNDTRDWNAAPSGPDAEKRGTTDRFVLTFEKPG